MPDETDSDLRMRSGSTFRTLESRQSSEWEGDMMLKLGAPSTVASFQEGDRCKGLYVLNLRPGRISWMGGDALRRREIVVLHQ